MVSEILVVLKKSEGIHARRNFSGVVLRDGF